MPAGSPILYGSAARAALLRGADQMAALIAPTLGPVSRTVAVAPIIGKDPPEVLDSAGTIARRTIELADPFENPGAMLIRDLVLQVSESAGDGGATAAVVAQALLHEGGRLVAGGVNVVRLCQGLRQGWEVARAALEQWSWKLGKPDEIARVARHAVLDPTLADTIGEILDTVGPDGIVMVQEGHGNETTHQYVDGVRWESGYVSTHLLPDGEATARIVEPRILITDQDIERPEQLVPAMEACVAAGIPRLVVIAPEMKDAALATLLANRRNGVLTAVLAINAPSIGYQRTGILGDLAAIVGGRCLRGELGERLESVTLDDLGSARQVWASRQSFGIVGGHGDRATIRRRVSDVRAELVAGGDDPYIRGKTRERIAKLTGTGATILVGAPSQRARALKRQQIEAALTSTRLALEGGVVAGGGGALLACASELIQMPTHGDERTAFRLLAHGLTAPARVIARNSGLEGRAIVHQFAQHAESGAAAFDVLEGRWVDTRAEGLVDPLGVTLAALDAAVSTAVTALTIEVLIRRLDPLRRIRK